MCAAAKTDRGKRFFLNLLVALIGLLIVIPILIVVLGSFKTSAETLVPNLNLPERWMWSNYVYVYEKGKIGRALLNSVFLTTVVVLICLIISALCAFVLSRRKKVYQGSRHVVQNGDDCTDECYSNPAPHAEAAFVWNIPQRDSPVYGDQFTMGGFHLLQFYAGSAQNAGRSSNH